MDYPGAPDVFPELLLQNQTGADQAAPAPVPSGTSLGVVIRTAMRQATQSVMKYIARKTTKLVYPPHSYSTNSPTRYANTSPAATRAKNQMIRAILTSLMSSPGSTAEMANDRIYARGSWSMHTCEAHPWN